MAEETEKRCDWKGCSRIAEVKKDSWMLHVEWRPWKLDQRNHTKNESAGREVGGDEEPREDIDIAPPYGSTGFTLPPWLFSDTRHMPIHESKLH